MYILTNRHNLLTEEPIHNSGLIKANSSLAHTDLISCSSLKALENSAEVLSPNIIVIDYTLLGHTNHNHLFPAKLKKNHSYVIALFKEEQYDKLANAINENLIDDYLLSPFDDKELVSRLTVAFKKSSRKVAAKKESPAMKHRAVDSCHNNNSINVSPTIDPDNNNAGFLDDKIQKRTIKEPLQPAYRSEEIIRDNNKISKVDTPDSSDREEIINPAQRTPRIRNDASRDEALIARQTNKSEVTGPVSLDSRNNAKILAFTPENKYPSQSNTHITVPPEKTEFDELFTDKTPVKKEATPGFRRNDSKSIQSDRPAKPPDPNETVNPKVKKASLAGRLLTFAGNVVFIVLIFLLATFSYYLIQSRSSGETPSLAGYQMYIVLSGSMNPAFNVGSVVFVREINPEQLTQGDIITFRSHAGSESLTTHRVVSVNHDEGNLSFVTRGDANSVNDPSPVLAENIIGRVAGSIPLLGHLLSFIQTRQGLILLIFIPGAIIILVEIMKIIKSRKLVSGL